MKIAETPRNEVERLQDLFSYRLLDTPPEPEYDNLVRLASLVAGTPIAMINFIDRHRQWVKAKVGIDIQEASRDYSFCAHAILAWDYFEVSDARTDLRFYDNPLVTDDPRIVFYLGIPLVSPAGHRLGTLCVIDSLPRSLNNEQIESLKCIAVQIVHLMTNRQRLLQQARLSALGEMSAGVAHEINNSLAIIRAACYQVQMVGASLKWDPKVAQRIEDVDSSVDRVARIVRGLLQVARNGVKDPFVECNLRQLTDETLGFCQARFHRLKIAVTVEIDPHISFEARPCEISQVILNIVNNSVDAITNLSEKWIHIGARDLGTAIELAVTDSGHGIPKDLQDKIMQPFFTTKQVGKGTGLGLSIVKGIVESHSGLLGLERKCENTRFLIRFPRRQTQPSQRATDTSVNDRTKEKTLGT